MEIWKEHVVVPFAKLIATASVSGRCWAGFNSIPREAVDCPYCYHPDDCGRGSRQRQGGDGRFGDVVGVSQNGSPSISATGSMVADS